MQNAVVGWGSRWKSAERKLSCVSTLGLRPPQESVSFSYREGDTKSPRCPHFTHGFTCTRALDASASLSGRNGTSSKLRFAALPIRQASSRIRQRSIACCLIRGWGETVRCCLIDKKEKEKKELQQEKEEEGESGFAVAVD